MLSRVRTGGSAAVAEVAALLVLLASVAVGAPADPPAELASRIDRLIHELDDELSEVREQAADSLIKIGSPAMDRLSAAAKGAPPEQAERLTRVLKRIAQAAAGLRFSSQIRRPDLNGAVTLVLSPDAKFVYVPGHIAAAINVFRRDAANGRLQHQQTIEDKDRLAGVVTLRLNSDGKYAIAAACRSKSIALYRRDETTGELTLATMIRSQPDGELNDLTWPIEAVFSTDDRFVYVIDDRKGLVFVFRIAGGDALSLVQVFEGEGRCFDGARGITAHPDGKTLYVSSHRPGALAVLDRDQATGRLGVRQILRDEQDGVHGLAGAIDTYVSPDGKFVYFVSGRFGGDDAIGVFQVADDGRLSLLQEFINEKSPLQDFAGGAKGIAISPDGEHFYASGARSGSLACFDRDRQSGKLTYVATFKDWVTGNKKTDERPTGNLGANGIGISPDGRFLYLALEDGSAISVLERMASPPAP